MSVEDADDSFIHVQRWPSTWGNPRALAGWKSYDAVGACLRILDNPATLLVARRGGSRPASPATLVPLAERRQDPGAAPALLEPAGRQRSLSLSAGEGWPLPVPR